MKFTLLIFICNCLVPTLEFGIYHPNGKEGHGNPNPDFKLWETRSVTININEAWTQRCRMESKRNYENNHRGIDIGNFPRYYVKKRLSVPKNAGPKNVQLPMYQYVASRHPIVRHGSETLDPAPINANHPNSFHTQLGMIYCERNTLKNMVMSGDPRARRTCGIEETLVTLCLRDHNHIMLDNNAAHGNRFALDLDVELPSNFPVHYGLGYSATVMKRHIEDNCLALAKIQIRVPERRDEIKMKEYLRGASMAGFTHFILKYECDESYWDVYEIDRILQPKKADDLRQIFRNSPQNWYFCIDLTSDIG